MKKIINNLIDEKRNEKHKLNKEISNLEREILLFENESFKKIIKIIKGKNFLNDENLKEISIIKNYLNNFRNKKEKILKEKILKEIKISNEISNLKNKEIF